MTFADSLAGGGAAGVADAPLLLTERCRLPDATASALSRLAPERVVLIGGPGAVCEEVAARVATDHGARVERVAGADRFDTSTRLAAVSGAASPDAVIVASGLTFPDGLAGGALSALSGYPLLLVDRCSLPPSVGEALRRIRPDRVLILGGSAAVCDGVLASISSAAR
jgi:putative cell wall-binding protein